MMTSFAQEYDPCLDPLAISNSRIIGNAIYDVRWNNTGSQLATASTTFNEDYCLITSCLTITDANSSQIIQSIQFSDVFITGLGWDPTGSSIAFTDYAGKVRKWHIATNSLSSPAQISNSYMAEIIWHPNGTKILAGGFENVLYSMDAATLQPIGSIALGKSGAPGFNSGIAWLKWNVNANLLAIGGLNGKLYIRDGNTLAPIVEWQLNAKQSVHGDWSPDSSKIASIADDMSIGVWDVATGQKILTLLSHTGEVNNVKWSPNGLFLASSSADGTIRIWNATSGQLLNTIVADPNPLPRLFAGTGHVDWSVAGKVAYGMTTMDRISGVNPATIPSVIITSIPAFTPPTSPPFS
jgi:WD40 repeat protein